MGAIKGAGDVAINSILTAKRKRKFTDLSDFISRIDASKVNKSYRIFIKSRSFDSFVTQEMHFKSDWKIVDGFKSFKCKKCHQVHYLVIVMNLQKKLM